MAKPAASTLQGPSWSCATPLPSSASHAGCPVPGSAVLALANAAHHRQLCKPHPGHLCQDSPTAGTGCLPWGHELSAALSILMHTQGSQHGELESRGELWQEGSKNIESTKLIQPSPVITQPCPTNQSMDSLSPQCFCQPSQPLECDKEEFLPPDTPQPVRKGSLGLTCQHQAVEEAAQLWPTAAACSQQGQKRAIPCTSFPSEIVNIWPCHKAEWFKLFWGQNEHNRNPILCSMKAAAQPSSKCKPCAVLEQPKQPCSAVQDCLLLLLRAPNPSSLGRT